MEYWSRLGTICYYDLMEYGPRLCEPTMLFMLGLEAVLTPSSEYIDTVPVIDKDTKEQIIDPETGEPLFEDKPNKERLKTCILHRDEIGEDEFKNAYFYLYDKQPKDDVTEINVVFRNLKVSLNAITGTSSNRTIPILYHENFGKPEIYDYDFETQKLLDILDCAGYKVKDTEVPYAGKFGVTDESAIELIDAYNADLKELHEKKKLYSQIYKTLDYKAMYIYALGVLYGCKCLGYDNNLIWRQDTSWYDGEYQNLIKTASAVFRFHYTHHICFVDADPHLFQKYKGIQTNRIWDFTEADIELKNDEEYCTSLSIEDGEVKETSIIYSKSSNEYSTTEDNEWKPLDETVLSSDPKIGIISNDSPIITRYIANNEVKLVSAYKYNKNKNKYLSPNNSDTYFCYTANTGWVSFSENLWKSYSIENPVLTLTPLGFDNIPSDAIQLARRIDDDTIVPYYESYISDVNERLGVDRRSLFGVLSSDTLKGSVVTVDNDAEFEVILSDEYFKSHYEFPIAPTEHYTLTDYYDLDQLISVYVYDEDHDYIWDPSGEIKPIVNFGYTLTPSIQLNTFIDLGNDEPSAFDLRYNEDEGYGYWSNTWEPREWLQSFEDDSVYKMYEDISLYKNIGVVAEDIHAYMQFINDAEDEYIFNNQAIEELATLNHGFIKLSSVLDLGITPYPCEIIYIDDNGNSLLDGEGNPLVWYDTKRQLYWNGLSDLNVWQSDKPILSTSDIFDAVQDCIIHVFVDDAHDNVIIDGTTLTLSEFYNEGTPNYRYVFVAETLLVFKDVIIRDCYHDNNADYDRYTISGLGKWVTKEHVIALGYRFVDGTSVLFNGNEQETIIFDDNPDD